MKNNIVKRIRRIVNRKNVRMFSQEPETIKKTIFYHVKNGLGGNPESLFDRRFSHIANFGVGNAGDALLPIALRDAFQSIIGGIQWMPCHVHDNVGVSELKKLDRCRVIIVGGGGLFISDTNKNNISGWQWPISIDQIRKLSGKLVIFSVGYNRFRGQSEFDEIFEKNLTALVEGSIFFGLRNTGSVEGIKKYLPERLHSQIKFQPCVTTVLKSIYPERFFNKSSGKEIISLNCAFDRSELRFGADSQAVKLAQVARAIKRLSCKYQIEYFAHSIGDEKMLSYLIDAKVPFKLVRLYGRSCSYILEKYRSVTLAIGMRGHAQMIPFGCERPILSLITHDKMRWFLDDIKASEWGVEMGEEALDEQIECVAMQIIERSDVVCLHMKQVREALWAKTIENITQIRRQIGI